MDTAPPRGSPEPFADQRPEIRQQGEAVPDRRRHRREPADSRPPREGEARRPAVPRPGPRRDPDRLRAGTQEAPRKHHCDPQAAGIREVRRTLQPLAGETQEQPQTRLAQPGAAARIRREPRNHFAPAVQRRPDNPVDRTAAVQGVVRRPGGLRVVRTQAVRLAAQRAVAVDRNQAAQPAVRTEAAVRTPVEGAAARSRAVRTAEVADRTPRSDRGPRRGQGVLQTGAAVAARHQKLAAPEARWGTRKSRSTYQRESRGHRNADKSCSPSRENPTGYRRWRLRRGDRGSIPWVTRFGIKKK